jgi:competence ComEA-like helix-hairpin-helix protein
MIKMEKMKRVMSFAWRSLSVLFVSSLAVASAQELPEGPGREETIRMCRQCHELARSISLRQDRDGWGTTMTKMVAYGMKATDQEIALVLDYLAKHFPADEVPRVNVNRASAIQLESGLSLRRSQAAALIAYREKHGGFKNLEDLKKVPALDADHLEARKNRIEF